ncbi:hypothetical protein COY23_04185 [bacterium (Candidatus Torokbacteria) CG_4_10_14_0_2_um_filter_35_8]|nr:MAG: hypothetical protein COY23_04185 [bacterium (Candidatus Torokbacteria) CG_4_10_14_0_2_um_filter_35_8]
MRICIIAQYFPPTSCAVSKRAFEMARFFANKKNQVIVICGIPNYPTGIKPKKYKLKFIKKERQNSIHIVRTFEIAAKNEGVLKRMLNYISFSLTSTIYLLFFLKKQDLIIASSPPLSVPIGPAIFGKIKSKKFILDIRDIWPEVAIDVGMIKNKLLIKILKYLEKKLYQKSDLIVTVTRGFQKNIFQKIKNKKIILIPNGLGSEIEWVKQKTRRNRNKTNIIYTGNQSHFQDLIQFIEFAKKMHKSKNPYLKRVAFIFVGEGEKKEKMKNIVKKYNLNNVKFIDQVSRKKAFKYIHNADIGLVSLANKKSLRSSLPTKTFEYMYFRKPILTNAKGELKEIIEIKAKCGLYFKSWNYKDFIKKLLKIIKNKKIARKMGRKGKDYVLKHYLLEKNLEKLNKEIISLFQD